MQEKQRRWDEYFMKIAETVALKSKDCGPADAGGVAWLQRDGSGRGRVQNDAERAADEILFCDSFRNERADFC